MNEAKDNNSWPILNFGEMQDTIETLHQWIQIIGKIRLRTMPWQNHSWHTSLYITSSGFSTQSIPYQGRHFQIDLNFKEHKLIIQCSNAGVVSMDLNPMTVADFYAELFKRLSSVGIEVKIHQAPNEIEPAIPFTENTINKSYDPKAASAIWQAMLKVNEVFSHFRSKFVGKASPVHLFWGAFDLAVTRFSGNDAPLHPGGMPNMSLEVMQEAYSQEVSSAGFWLGSESFPQAAFYAYAYPAHAAFAHQEVSPKAAYYSPEMGEFFLNYSEVQKANDPERMLSDFLETTYAAAANTSNWNRGALEKK